MMVGQSKLTTHLIHRDEETERADSQTADETTHHDLVPLIGRRDLHDYADAKNPNPAHDTLLTTNPIGNRSSCEGAEQSTD
jgi:hypothetical protein